MVKLSVPTSRSQLSKEKAFTLIDAGHIKAELLTDPVKHLEYLFPNGKIKGNSFYIGDIQGNKGDSLVITLRGQYAGKGKDFATGESYDLFDCFAYHWNLQGKGNFRALLNRLSDYLGLSQSEAKPLSQAEIISLKTRQEANRLKQIEAEKADRELAIKMQQTALMLWNKAISINDLKAKQGQAYLQARGLNIETNEDHVLRYLPNAYHRELKQNLPCIIARISDTHIMPIMKQEGMEYKPLGIERHYLPPEPQTTAEAYKQWFKDRGIERRKNLGTKNKKGGVVMLNNKHWDFRLVLCEGVIDAYSLMLYITEDNKPLDANIWAFLGVSNLEDIKIPSHVTEIIYFIDNDKAGNESRELLKNNPSVKGHSDLTITFKGLKNKNIKDINDLITKEKPVRSEPNGLKMDLKNPNKTEYTMSKFDLNDKTIFETIETVKIGAKYNSTLENNGYANGHTPEATNRLNESVNDVNTQLQITQVTLQQEQTFKDISSDHPYQINVIKAYLGNLYDMNPNINPNATQQPKAEAVDPIMKGSNDNEDGLERIEGTNTIISLSCNSPIHLQVIMNINGHFNFTISDNKTFEIIIKFIAKFAHNRNDFDYITRTFFKDIYTKLQNKSELESIINQAIKSKNKFIYKPNTESRYGALCFKHMKQVFKDVINVGGALYDLKNKCYFDGQKGFDACFARNGQEFILNTKLLSKYNKITKRKEEYYKVNTTTSPYKAIQEAETPSEIIKKYDAIANNPFKPYGKYQEGGKTYFNTFIAPTVRRTPFESDIEGINLFLDIMKAQYTKDDYEALLNFLAQIAQNPFIKLGYAPFLQGTQGTGKNLILEKLPYYFLTGLRKGIDAECDPFSNYYRLINSDTFKGTTNPFIRDVFFMYISEVKDFTISDMNGLKEKINGSEITIRQHYHAPEFIKNRINFAFSSNYKNGLKIEQNERRYLCIFSKFQCQEDLIEGGYRDATGKSDYWNAVFNWLHNQDGYAKVYDYFMKRDVSNVTTQDAPITTSKLEAVVSGYDNYTALLSEYELPPIITACTARELIQRKDRNCTSVNRVATALNNLGYEKHPIMSSVNRQIRYGSKRYIIYVQNDTVYKNETDKNKLCSIVEALSKEIAEGISENL